MNELAFTTYESEGMVYFDSNKANHFYYFDDFSAVWIHEVIHHLGFHHDVERDDDKFLDEEDFNLLGYYVLESARKINPSLFVPKFLKIYILMLNAEIDIYNEEVRKTVKERNQKYKLIEQVKPAKVYEIFNQTNDEGKQFYDLNTISFKSFLKKIYLLDTFKGKDTIVALRAFGRTIEILNPNFKSPEMLKGYETNPKTIGSISSLKSLNCVDFVETYNVSYPQELKKLNKLKRGLVLLGTSGVFIGTFIVSIPSSGGLAIIGAGKISAIFGSLMGEFINFSTNSEKLILLESKSKKQKRLIRKILRKRNLDKSHTEEVKSELLQILEKGITTGQFCDGDKVKKYKENYKWIKSELGI